MADDDEPRDELQKTPPAPMSIQAQARLSGGSIENAQLMEVLLDLQGQTSRVEGAQIVLANQNGELRRDMRDASESRSRLHERFNDLKAEVAAARADAKSAADQAAAALATLKTVTPDVADFVRIKRAGVMVVGAIGAILMVALATLAKEAWHWLASHINWR